MVATVISPLTMSRRLLLRAGLAATACVAARTALGETAGYQVIRQGGEQLFEALETMPYVSEGSGAPVYVMVSQTCPFCKALWRDHKRIKSTIEFRWVPLPYTRDDRNQIAQLQQSRRIDDLDRYMAQTLPAGDMHSDEQKIQTYSDATAKATLVRQIIKNNGLAFGTPIWLWKKHGVIEYAAGYDEASFRSIILHLAA